MYSTISFTLWSGREENDAGKNIGEEVVTQTYLYLGGIVPIREYVEQRRVRHEVKPYASAHNIAMMIAQRALVLVCDIMILMCCQSVFP